MEPSTSSTSQPASRKALFAVLMMSASALAYFKILLLGRLLGKDEYGQYLYLTSLISYLVPLVSLGLLDGFSRAQPLLMGSGRTAEARELRNTCLGAIVSISPGVVAVLVEIGVALGLPGKGFDLGILALGALQLIVVQVYYLLLRDVRSNLRTTIYAAFLCARGVADFAAVVPLSRAWGIRGALLGDAGSVVLVSAALAIFAVEGLGVRLAKLSALTALAKEGAQIILSGIVSTTALMMDRLVLGMVLSPGEYAVYGVHALILTVAGIGANMVYQYTFPRLVHLQASQAGPSGLVAATRRLSMNVLGVAVLLGPAVYGGFLLLARVFYPGYAIDPVLLALLCLAAVVEVSNVYPTSLMASGMHRLNLSVQLLFVILMLAGVTATIFLGAGMRWMAAVLVAGRAVGLLAGMVALGRVGHPPPAPLSTKTG